MTSLPSPVRNTSTNSDTAGRDMTIGEISFDACLAVHIKDLASGHPQSGNRAVTPNPITSRHAAEATATSDVREVQVLIFVLALAR